MFVCLTGYGKITPKTGLGQGITIAICLFRIPISMLAFKTAGELVASLLRYAIIKTETVLLKWGEPKHIKKKTFLAASLLAVALHILCGASATYSEGWSFMTSLYAWFTTFTTIGFGDYVPFEALQRKLDQGKVSADGVIVHGWLGLVSPPAFWTVLLTLWMTRDFRNRYFSC